MEFAYSERCEALREKLLKFMDDYIYPNERRYKDEVDRNGREKGNRWIPTEIVEELKPIARAQGLWNLFLPKSHRAPEGLSNLDYAALCEIMGRIPWAPEVFNCSAPDTGNMETIERYGTEEHKSRWLEPLLRGEIRSAFLMTEPDVASSDATNIHCSIVRDGDDYVINGRKWWITGAMNPDCAIFIVMGKTDPSADRHQQQSMVLVPRDTPGVEIVRAMEVYGYDDHDHHHNNAAAFGLHGALVVGAPLAVTDGNRAELATALPGFTLTLRRAGAVVDTGVGANVLDSPALALDELARRLGRRCRAEIHGRVLGSGLEMTAFCGWVRCRPDAVLGLPELALGLIPGAGGTVSVTRRIGRWRTAYLVLSGQPIDPATALGWGLIDEIG